MTDSVTAFITTLSNELKKEYIALDAQDRPEIYYQAPIHTADGGPCLVTQVEYKAIDSTQIVKSRESVGVWLSTYDI